MAFRLVALSCLLSNYLEAEEFGVSVTDEALLEFLT